MKQKQVLITKKGGPEVLEIVEREAPEPGPGEARVKVLATGVAFADVMMRYGLYPGVPNFPFTPGKHGKPALTYPYSGILPPQSKVGVTPRKERRASEHAPRNGQVVQRREGLRLYLPR